MKHLPLLRQVDRTLTPLLADSRLWSSDSAVQHGDTTVLLHCLAVAYFSYMIAKAIRIHFDQESLVRGALLHDYFLYDWHTPEKSHRLHGFRHAKTALRNADHDFTLSDTERDIIVHHMFPLNPQPPRSREAALVCLVDKGCGLYETFRRNTYPDLRVVLDSHRNDKDSGETN